MSQVVKQSRSHLSTAFGAFFLLASYGILMGALPSELASRGLKSNQIGLIVGCNALGAFGFRFLALNVIDRMGAAKIASVSSFCSVVASLGLAAIMVHYQATAIPLAGVNFIQGAATSAFLTSGYTYCAQVGDPAKRATRIGLYGSIASIGLLLTPPIGIWLWSAGTNFYLWLMPALLALPAMILMPGDHRDAVRVAEPGENEGSLIALLGFALLAPLVALAVSAGIQGGFEAQMPFLVKDFSAQSIIVALYAFFGIAVAGGRFGGGWLADFAGAKPIFFVGLALQTCALFLPLATPNAIGLLLSSIIFGAGSGMVGTAAITLLSLAAPEHRSGAAIGLAGLVRDAGFAVGAAATGLVVAVGGARAFLCGGILLTVVSLMMSARIYRSRD